MLLFENNLNLRPRITTLRCIFLAIISMYLNFYFGFTHEKTCNVLMYILFEILKPLWQFVHKYCYFFFLSHFNLWGLNVLPHSTFKKKKHTIVKISYGFHQFELSNCLCEFEDWKRLVQHLADTPTFAELYMSEA